MVLSGGSGQARLEELLAAGRHSFRLRLAVSAIGGDSGDERGDSGWPLTAQD